MIHSLLCQDKDLAPYFLPVDFNLTKAAMKNNIRAKKVAQDCLKRNIPILIFPSGFVSTASKKVLAAWLMRPGLPLPQN